MNKLCVFLLMSIGPSALVSTYAVTIRSSAANVSDQTVVTASTPTAPPTLVSAYLVAKGDAHTIVMGRTLQFTAYGKYSDGSVVALPDSEADPEIAWNTSNHAVAKISLLGHVTALNAGTVSIEAVIGTITASPWTVTVLAAPPPVPPTVSCSASPSVINPGSTAIITADGSSQQDLPLTYSYSASTGSISGTSASETLETPVSFEGLVTVTCVVDQQGGGSASATTNVLVATSSGNLDGARNWKAVHDSATSGESMGSSVYPVTTPPYDDARQFYMTYSDRGGERFSLSFGSSVSVTHFLYDTYIYFVNPSQVQNVELDINQVMSNGQTVIFGTQCSSNSGTWEYTTAITDDGDRKSHWNASSIPCNPKTWTANSWHQVQIASSRDSSGNVTYDWVTLDGATSNFVNATGPSALSLGWAVGDLSLNFQLDGANEASGSITAYIEDLTIYGW
jgi:Bacterial Ig-like domain (group 2)